ncbi:hypothetical protein PHSC3_000358 [Chlamydiales bacterium STE3]|nr:hypothetical protein PHSC3_000358 [Chlamydiales bacterium STE3]
MKASIFILLLTFSISQLHASNYTTEVNGWGYTEIRQRSLLPILTPLGAVTIAGTIAFLVDQAQSSRGSQSHQH